MQKIGELAIFAYCIFYYQTFIKNYAVNVVTIWESILPNYVPQGRGTVVAFCEKILVLGEGI